MGRCECFSASLKCIFLFERKNANWKKKRKEKEKPETFTHDDDTFWLTEGFCRTHFCQCPKRILIVSCRVFFAISNQLLWTAEFQYEKCCFFNCKLWNYWFNSCFNLLILKSSLTIVGKMSSNIKPNIQRFDYANKMRSLIEKHTNKSDSCVWFKLKNPACILLCLTDAQLIL